MDIKIQETVHEYEIRHYRNSIPVPTLQITHPHQGRMRRALSPSLDEGRTRSFSHVISRARADNRQLNANECKKNSSINI